MSVSGLRKLNIFATVFFAAQVVVLLIVAKPASLPVTGQFLVGPPGAGEYGSTELFSLRIDLLVALFLTLAAIDHLLVATIGRGWYEKNISEGRNPARW